MSGPSRKVLGRLRRSAGPSTGDAGRRKPHRGTPPDAIGRGPLVSAPGLRLGIVVPVRDEAPYLEEWLAYHVALGVEHVFIYDNGSSDDLGGVVEGWVNHGLVTVVHWPLPGGQLDAYSHALRFFGAAVDWLAFVDVDEFIVPLVDDDIPSLLARWPDATDVRVPRVDFGFSGHRDPPDALTIEAYTEVADVFARDPSKPPRVKSIVRPRGVTAMGIHTATLAEAGVDDAIPRESVGRRSGEYAQVNHYYTRSFAEFEAKRVRGSATGRQDRPPVAFDLPAQRIDTSAHRFVERTGEVIERMRSLSPSPYHYGSELGFDEFPHYNDLGLFGEFVVANAAAEEPGLRREPRTRMANLHPGTGFVGDVGASAIATRHGALSSSIHLEPLLDRARGRVDAVLSASDAAEMAFSVAAATDRRCYAVGFVVAVTEAARLLLDLDGPDGPAPPAAVEVSLPAATTYAGIVEVAADPRLVDRVRVRVTSAAADATVYDLFLVSYG